MIPAFLIPLVVQIATRAIKYGFDQLEKKPEVTKAKVLDKIEKNEKKAEAKHNKGEYENVDW
jgi:hypothetical protein